MCQFLSGIYVRRSEGVYDILTAPELTDSHRVLVDIFGLRHDRDSHYIQFEFTPPTNCSWLDLDKWEFKLDAFREQEWFTEDVRADLITKLKALVESHINKDKTWAIFVDNNAYKQLYCVKRLWLFNCSHKSIGHQCNVYVTHSKHIRISHSKVTCRHTSNGSFFQCDVLIKDCNDIEFASCSGEVFSSIDVELIGICPTTLRLINCRDIVQSTDKYITVHFDSCSGINIKRGLAILAYNNVVTSFDHGHMIVRGSNNRIPRRFNGNVLVYNLSDIHKRVGGSHITVINNV